MACGCLPLGERSRYRVGRDTGVDDVFATNVDGFYPKPFSRACDLFKVCVPGTRVPTPHQCAE